MACLLGKKAVVDNLVIKIMHYQNQSLVFFQHKQGIRARPLAVKTAADKGDRNRIYFISTQTHSSSPFRMHNLNLHCQNSRNQVQL